MRRKYAYATFALALLLAALSLYLYTHPQLLHIPSDPEAASEITFYALGDQGDGSVNQWAVADAMEKAAEKAGKLDFVALLGDNFYTDQTLALDSGLWQSRFENVYSGNYLSATPFYAVLGNNDPQTMHGDNVEIEYARRNMGSNRWRMPDNYYAYDFGRAGTRPLVRIVFLDTNLPEAELRQEADFIRQQFAQRENGPVWRIVMGHHPIRTYGKHYGKDRAKAAILADAMKQAQVDLYLAGHDHNQQVIASAAEPVYVINGGGGAHTYEISHRAPELIFARRGHGFAGVHASATRLDLALYDTQPATVAAYRIERACQGGPGQCLQALR